MNVSDGAAEAMRKISGQTCPWLLEDGPEDDVVVSSRVRLARNVANTKFAHKADHVVLASVVDKRSKTRTLRELCFD